MAFCKVCSCGEKIVFARRMGYPDTCPKCGRRIADFPTLLENDPQVEELVKRANIESDVASQQIETEVEENATPNVAFYSLLLSNGKEIHIPPEGGIIGRTELGGEELAEYPSVSRKHLRITPRRDIGLLIEDISSYGTLVNGTRIEKNLPTLIKGETTITLCNVETHLITKE